MGPSTTSGLLLIIAGSPTFSSLDPVWCRATIVISDILLRMDRVPTYYSSWGYSNVSR